MMDVILREDIKTLGKAGDMVRVKPGYARNYLLPNGLAYEATEGNKARIAGETKARNARQVAERAEAQQLAAALNGLELTITGKAGDEGKLFGSITAQDIADALAKQGRQIDRRRIALEHPIKTVGQHTVSVKLHPEIQADVRVTVAAQ